MGIEGWRFLWQLLFCFDYRNIRRASCTQLFSNIFRPPKIKKIPPKRPVGPCALSRACPEPPGVLFRAQTVGILAKIGHFSVGRKSCVLGGRRDPNKRETAIGFVNGRIKDFPGNRFFFIFEGFSGPPTAPGPQTSASLFPFHHIAVSLLLGSR